ncbi:MAG: hypothetical protein ACREBR_01240, partial [bacterium]
FHACGRGGEVSAATWNSACWDDDQEMLVLDWREFKTAEESMMTFHPDASSFHLDQFHSFACYLIAGSGRLDAAITGNETIKFIFPGFVNMVSGGAAAKVSRILKACFDEGVPGMTAEMTSHGLRVSSADTMVFNKTVDLVMAIFRGNWNFEGECLILHYLTKKLFVTQAGKALAGFPNTTIDVSAPTVDAIRTSANTEILNSFCIELFGSVPVPQLHTTLKGFRNAMVACLLMYREDVRKEVGEDNMIFKHITGVDVRRGISSSELRGRGTAIKERFYLNYARNLSKTGNEMERVQNAAEIIANAASDLKEKGNETNVWLRDLTEKANENNVRLRTLEDLVARLTDQMETHLVMTATSTNSPSPKRKKRNEDGVAFSSDMQAATSASTVERTIVVARDAIQSIMLGSARSVAPSFRNIKDMSVAKLMTEIVTQGINISQKNCFGDDIGPKMKLRAKRVFEIALSFVPENDNKLIGENYY